MRRQVALFGGFIALCAAGSASADTGGWRIVKSGSASGDFAAKSIRATVSHPRALAVRLFGNVYTGQQVVSCSKGRRVASWHISYSHAGTFALPMTRGASSCDVVASVGGSGRVTVQIFAYT